MVFLSIPTIRLGRERLMAASRFKLLPRYTTGEKTGSQGTHNRPRLAASSSKQYSIRDISALSKSSRHSLPTTRQPPMPGLPLTIVGGHSKLSLAHH